MAEIPVERLSRFAHEHSSALVYCGFGLLVFIASLAATFPYAATLSDLLRPANLRFSSSGQGISFPLGAALRDVRLASLEPDSQFEVESSKVTLAPALGALLLGEPGLRVHARLYGGALRATLYRNGTRVGVSFIASGMGLARMTPLRRMGGHLLGRVSGGGWAEFESGNPSAMSGDFEFRATDFTMRIADGVAPVRLGTLTVVIRLARGGALQIKSLTGSGPDGTIQGQGTITVGADARESRIALALMLQPSVEGRRRLGVLFSLLPHPPDSRAYLLSGPLTSPSIS
jgi:type II secretion system protein N